MLIIKATILRRAWRVRVQARFLCISLELGTLRAKKNVGALIIRIGFWGIFYYDYNGNPQKNSLFAQET